MNSHPAITSAEAQRKYLPSKAIYVGDGPAWKDLHVEIFQHRPVQDCVLVPAVAEPQIMWQISGAMVCEERDLGGAWSAHDTKPGDTYIVASTTPYELRWQSVDGEPLLAMHVFLGERLLAEASHEVLGKNAEVPALKEVYAARDRVLNGMLDQLRAELMDRRTASKLLVQGVAQSLAVHIVRNYRAEARSPRAQAPANVLPAFRFRKIETLMQQMLEQGIQIEELAAAVDMSKSHFSRMFKNTTGRAPMQHFIRLRMAKARQLLRETDRSVIQIGMEVGYSTPSHFAQVFRKETGLTPTEYRQAAPNGLFVD